MTNHSSNVKNLLSRAEWNVEQEPQIHCCLMSTGSLNKGEIWQPHVINSGNPNSKKLFQLCPLLICQTGRCAACVARGSFVENSSFPHRYLAGPFQGLYKALSFLHSNVKEIQENLAYQPTQSIEQLDGDWKSLSYKKEKLFFSCCSNMLRDFIMLPVFKSNNSSTADLFSVCPLQCWSHMSSC